MTQEELSLPFRLLKYCDGDLPKCGLFREALLSAASEMDTLRNNGTNIDHNNIDIFLPYCLNALGKDTARLAAEYELMGLLVMLCSRSNYVTYFHHEKDVNYVLAEVQDILSVDNDGNDLGGSSALCAVQSFSNLIYHLAVYLGSDFIFSSDHALILYLSGSDYVFDE